MPTKRLVVLDERDYKNLIDESKKCKTETEQSLTVPEIPKEPEDPKEVEKPLETAEEASPEPKDLSFSEESEDPVQEEEAKQDVPSEVSPEKVVPEDKSQLEQALEKVPKVAHQDALDLLDRLSKFPSFEQVSGEIILNGKPLENYSLQQFLVAVCDKRADDDIPVPLRVFLRKNNIRKFRNKKIKLPPLTTWTNLHD